MELSKRERIEWSKFLATDAGKAGRAYLMEGLLNLIVTKGESPNVTAIEAGELRGYRQFMQNFDSLSNLDTEQPQNLDT